MRDPANATPFPRDLWQDELGGPNVVEELKLAFNSLLARSEEFSSVQSAAQHTTC